jgi:hypothetical protein
MNKIFTITVYLVAAAFSACAQGIVNFNNAVSFVTPADRAVYIDFVGGRPLVGTQFRAQLYAGAQGTAPSDFGAIPSSAPFRAPGTTAPGTWSGGNRTLPYAEGTTIQLQVRVWDGSQFGSWEQAVQGGGSVLWSAPFSYFIPASGQQSSAYYLENLRAFGPNLSEPPPVPEPDLGLYGMLGVGFITIQAYQTRKPRCR